MKGWKVPAAVAALGIAAAGGYFGWKAYGPLQLRLCEEFIKETLASPSSYRRANVIEVEEPTSISDLQKLRPPSFWDKLYLDQPRSLHLVSVEYDAANAYGANLRGYGTCAFEKKNGEFYSSTIMRSSARMSMTSARLRGLVDSGALPDTKPGSMGPAPKYPCCLN
jgi:hypothetical protein